MKEIFVVIKEDGEIVKQYKVPCDEQADEKVDLVDESCHKDKELSEDVDGITVDGETVSFDGNDYTIYDLIANFYENLCDEAYDGFEDTMDEIFPVKDLKQADKEVFEDGNQDQIPQVVLNLMNKHFGDYHKNPLGVAKKILALGYAEDLLIDSDSEYKSVKDVDRVVNYHLDRG